MVRRFRNNQRGIALIMVIFMIVISSALLVSLTDSTYTSLRLNQASEQRLRAEYILKSAIDVARVLLQSDSTDFDNPREDAWMKFVEGAEVPGELVGIAEPNVRVSLLISPENSKIPLLNVVTLSSTVDPAWRDVLVTLFRNLGFDAGDPSNSATGAGAPIKQYTSAEMVANLIDYLDTDKNSYSEPNFDGQGMEADLPLGEEFRNDGTMESLASELGSVPGFTPSRVQRILPFVSNRTRENININSAPVEVLQALIQGLDSTAAPEDAQRIVDCRSPALGGPFNQGFRGQLTSCIDPNVASRIGGKLAAKANAFTVVAKVEYGLSTFMASAHVTARGGRLPILDNLVLY